MLDLQSPARDLFNRSGKLETTVSDVDDIAIRLESALARIEAAAERRPIADQAAEAAEALKAAEVAARLDALIEDLRAQLAALDEE